MFNTTVNKMHELIERYDIDVLPYMAYVGQQGIVVSVDDTDADDIDAILSEALEPYRDSAIRFYAPVDKVTGISVTCNERGGVFVWHDGNKTMAIVGCVNA